jgi:hypothetical protein
VAALYQRLVDEHGEIRWRLNRCVIIGFAAVDSTAHNEARASRCWEEKENLDLRSDNWAAMAFHGAATAAGVSFLLFQFRQQRRPHESGFLY